MGALQQKARRKHGRRPQLRRPGRAQSAPLDQRTHREIHAQRQIAKQIRFEKNRIFIPFGAYHQPGR